MKKIAALSAFTALSASALCSYAQPKAKAKSGQSAASALHALADANGDGDVTYQELSALVHDSVTRQIQKRFAQLDRDGDGRCTRAEVNIMDPERFARLDLNSDGAFNLMELDRAMRPQINRRLLSAYAKLDVNHDGRLALAEVAPPEPQVTKPAKTVAGGGPAASGQF